MPAEVDFERFRADSGLPFGAIFAAFRYFWGGRNFDAIWIEFRLLIWETRWHERGLWKLIPSLQTPKTPTETDNPLITLYTPKGCGES